MLMSLCGVAVRLLCTWCCGENSSALFRSTNSMRLPLGGFEQLDRAPGVVGQREHLVELDLRLHAVSLDDAVEPRPAVKAPRVLEGLPLIDTPRPAGLAPDEVLAEQALHLPEPRGDLVEVRAAGGVVDVRRELVADSRGYHPAHLIRPFGPDTQERRHGNKARGSRHARIPEGTLTRVDD